MNSEKKGCLKQQLANWKLKREGNDENLFVYDILLNHADDENSVPTSL
jgi:hypothetical protein